MNKLRTLLAWGLLAAATHVMGYTITVSPIEIEAGQSTNLVINLNNTETNLTAYQMSLYLPEGVTVQKKSNGKYAYTANPDRHDGAFTVSVKDAADGSVLIAVFSADKDVLTGTSGELIRLPIDVASTVTTSLEGSIKNIEFTDVNAQAHKLADVNFTMTMEAVTSPNINFTDANVKAVCVANWDTNGDGELSCGEAAAVTSITNNTGFMSNTTITSFDELSYFTGLTQVGSYAFYGCNGLTSITLPNGVTNIGSSAFRYCSGLTSITIPESVASIGTYAFQLCSGLTSVTIPNSVNSIGNHAFNGCSGLTSIIVEAENTKYDSRNSCNAIIETETNTMIVGCQNTIIPSSVTSIGVWAFWRCSGLTSITIPNSVTSIGKEAFVCDSLTSVTIDITTPLPIESGTFSNRANATLYVPAGSKPAYEAADYWKEFKEIIEIGTESEDGNIKFADANVKAICVSNWDTNDDGELSEAEAAAVTSLGAAFRDNTLIKQFTELQYLTGLTTIPDSAFYNCKYLASITLPASITSIGVRAFCACSSLTTVTFPSSVTSIGDYAFQNCYKLSSITIPKNVTKFGNYVFYNCNGLASLEVQEGNTVYDSRGNCNAIIKTATNTLIVGCKNTIIPEDVTAIDGYAFKKATGLVSIIIPQSVTSIGKSSFSACTGLTDVWCYAKNVPSTKTNAFDGSSIGTATLHVPGASLNAYSSAAPWNNFASIIPIEENYSPTIAFADANVKAVCIANWDTDGDGELSEAEAEAVTSLGTAFRNNTQIKKFDELQYFTALTAIPDSAFYNCKYLASVTLPDNVTSIGVRAFYYCNRLTSVALPESVTSIGNYAFHNCYNLASVLIPRNVASIGNYVFFNCNSLASLEVQEGNTAYDSRNNCNAIIKTSTNTLIAGCKNTIIPKNVTTIGDYAFRKATGLVSITIPQSVTSIGNNSFSACTGLTDVWCYAQNVPSTKTNAFEGSSIGTATLHVPASSVNAYSTTAPWSGFGSIVAIDGTGSSNTIAGADIMARSGQQVKLPIALTNEDDLTVVGISFTLTLPQGVTVATDMDGEPIFSLESARLNPNRFTVYVKQKANSSWNFLIVTNSATAALAGTEGAFMTVTLGIADGMANGSYDISLTDNKLSVKENNNLVNSIRLDDTSSTLTIDNSQTDFIMGDVNGDGDVDLSDAIMVIYYSMDETPANFNEAAADMNADGEIDLSDAILIIYRSLGVQLGSNARRRNVAAAENSDILQLDGDGNSFGMSLSNENTYLGFQCDIKLPEGATLYSIDLNESRAAGHTLMYNRLDDGSYRVVAFSLKGESFFGNMGDLLLFTTEGAEQGEVSMENIFFIDSDLNKVAFNDITAIATGISPAFADTNDTPVYNLAGQMVNVKSSNRKLQKGIYISKGRKTVK